ncbi:ATP-binding cassette domain-containing protein [Actinomadura sp. DSM 109109]|nr:ATP-binding cassette domain-containing protein [Actinomadura lepetitiana]
MDAHNPAHLMTCAGALARTVRQATRTAAPPPRRLGAVVLRLRNVAKRYRRRQVLREVNLDLRVGEVAGIVGANGSGKSTLLNIRGTGDAATRVADPAFGDRWPEAGPGRPGEAEQVRISDDGTVLVSAGPGERILVRRL